MYLFIYKTTHINGKYYIGRHSTKKLNDGYFGSGKWIKSIKDKTDLSREIIKEANSFEELYRLEEYYINIHYDDPLCMNWIKGSRGWNSEDAKRITSDLVKTGKHNLLKREDGSSVSKENAIKRVKEGTHNFLKDSNGNSLSKIVQENLVKEGKHSLQNCVSCYNKYGEFKKIPCNEFHSQLGNKEDWEWVHMLSNEGKRRRKLKK